MSNTILTIDMITREALRLAHEKCSFIGTTVRSYDDSFAKTGAKAGDTIRIRKPARYVRRQGSRIMNVQDSEQEKTTLTVATQDGVDIAFTSAERALSLDDFAKEHLEPAMAALMSGVEADYIAAMTKLTYNSVGTVGTVPNDLEIFANAQAKLNQSLAPQDDNRSVMVSSVTMAKMVGSLKGLFHDGDQIKKQYREGIIGRTTMADWYGNERVYRHATGSDHTTVTVNDASIAEGDSVITTAGASVTVGTVFTIDNVYAVHPETKQQYSHLQQFVITAISSNDWTISPAYYSTGAKKNVNALPVTTAAINLLGSASTTYGQDLMYHKDAYAFATVDLPIMPGECSRKTFDGISLRIWSDGDIRNDELLTRIDLLYGFAALRPEFGCRISN